MDRKFAEALDGSELVCVTILDSSPKELSAWTVGNAVDPIYHHTLPDEVVSMAYLRDGWMSMLSLGSSIFAINICNGDITSQPPVSEDDVIPASAIGANNFVGYLVPAPNCMRFLHVRDSFGVVHVWFLDSSRSQLEHRCRIPPCDGFGGHPAAIESVTWFDTCTHVAICASAFLVIFDITDWNVLLNMCQADVIGRGIGRRITCAVAKPGGMVIVSGSNNGHLIEWDVSGIAIGTCSHHQPHKEETFFPMTDVQFTESGLLVSMQGDWNADNVASVRVWDTNSRPWPCLHNFDSSGFAVVTHQPCFVLCSEHDGTVSVWDVVTGSRLATLVHDDVKNISLWGLEVSTCGKFVALAAGPSDKVNVYNMDTLEAVCSTSPEVNMFELVSTSVADR